ncbi:unnamed protein product [Symbiodinium natans]|uniref:Uncharacterized protein n=1 Tax=Symbiodinium natans TaxID=878477 RepID=A0A812MZK2_9DINO|nr:unnamed protein product [Symbiodinium natans]
MPTINARFRTSQTYESCSHLAHRFDDLGSLGDLSSNSGKADPAWRTTDRSPRVAGSMPGHGRDGGAVNGIGAPMDRPCVLLGISRCRPAGAEDTPCTAPVDLYRPFEGAWTAQVFHKASVFWSEGWFLAAATLRCTVAYGCDRT